MDGLSRLACLSATLASARRSWRRTCSTSPRFYPSKPSVSSRARGAAKPPLPLHETRLRGSLDVTTLEISLGLHAVEVGSMGDDLGARVGDDHVVLVVSAPCARRLEAPLDGEAHARSDHGGRGRLDPGRSPVEPEAVPPRAAHRRPRQAMTAGVGRGLEYLLAAPGDGAERLAGS